MRPTPVPAQPEDGEDGEDDAVSAGDEERDVGGVPPVPCLRVSQLSVPIRRLL